MSGDRNEEMGSIIRKKLAQLNALRLQSQSGQSGEYSFVPVPSKETKVYEIWVHNKKIKSSIVPQSNCEPSKYAALKVDITTIQDLELAFTLITDETFGENREIIFCRQEITPAQFDPASGIGVWKSLDHFTERAKEFSNLDFWKYLCVYWMKKDWQQFCGVKIEKLQAEQGMILYHWDVQKAEILQLFSSS